MPNWSRAPAIKGARQLAQRLRPLARGPRLANCDSFRIKALSSSVHGERGTRQDARRRRRPKRNRSRSAASAAFMSVKGCTLEVSFTQEQDGLRKKKEKIKERERKRNEQAAGVEKGTVREKKTALEIPRPIMCQRERERAWLKNRKTAAPMER